MDILASILVIVIVFALMPLIYAQSLIIYAFIGCIITDSGDYPSGVSFKASERMRSGLESIYNKIKNYVNWDFANDWNFPKTWKARFVYALVCVAHPAFIVMFICLYFKL